MLCCTTGSSRFSFFFSHRIWISDSILSLSLQLKCENSLVFVWIIASSTILIRFPSSVLYEGFLLPFCFFSFTCSKKDSSIMLILWWLTVSWNFPSIKSELWLHFRKYYRLHIFIVLFLLYLILMQVKSSLFAIYRDWKQDKMNQILQKVRRLSSSKIM